MADSIVFIVANKKSSSQLGGLQYFPDCTVSISHTFDNDVTEHTVEDGSSFTDHIQNKNAMFSVSGIYNTVSFNKYLGDTLNQQDRVTNAYKFLKGLRDDRKTFTLVSKYDVYKDCTIKSLRFPVAPTDGNTLLFEMDIVQVRKSKLELVNIVTVANVIESKQDDASNSSVSGKNPTDEKATEKSIAKYIVQEVIDIGTSAEDLAELTKKINEGGG